MLQNVFWLVQFDKMEINTALLIHKTQSNKRPLEDKRFSEVRKTVKKALLKGELDPARLHPKRPVY